MSTNPYDYGIKFDGDPQVYGERDEQFKPTRYSRRMRLGYRPEYDLMSDDDGPFPLRRTSHDPDRDRMYEWALDHGINIRDETARQRLAQLVLKDAWFRRQKRIQEKKQRELRKKLAMLATSRGNFEGLPLELRHKIRSYRYNKNSKKSRKSRNKSKKSRNKSNKKLKHKSRKSTLHSPKGWRKLAPKSRKERSRIYKKCGSKCFLKPDKRNTSKSKFPICSKRSCKINCKGLSAAYTRSRQLRKRKPSYGRVATKAKKMSKRLCKRK